MSDLYKLTIAEASKQLSERKISSVDLTKSVLDRIKQVEPKVEAYLKVLEDSAIKEAEESDKRRQAGKPLSKLDGIPIAVKDLFCTKDVETTAASNILKGFTPCYDATAVKKLKDAGAVLVGKLNQDAFAHGSSTENSDFKVTKNPWDLERVPGGSSGGSAAAVAADECLGALGTDTGGSIRQPSSLCSVVGLKPTYGRVSRYGVIAMASSLDVIGPICKSTEDVALMMEVIAGRDPLDGTTLDAPVPEYSKELAKDIKGLKVGVPKEYFAEGMDGDVKNVIESSIEKLKSLGAETIEISLPHTDMALATYYILQPAEVSSNLSRYDGIKYGFSILRDTRYILHDTSLSDVYFTSRGGGFGAEVGVVELL